MAFLGQMMQQGGGGASQQFDPSQLFMLLSSLMLGSGPQGAQQGGMPMFSMLLQHLLPMLTQTGSTGTPMPGAGGGATTGMGGGAQQASPDGGGIAGAGGLLGALFGAGANSGAPGSNTRPLPGPGARMTRL